MQPAFSFLFFYFLLISQEFLDILATKKTLLQDSLQQGLDRYFYVISSLMVTTDFSLKSWAMIRINVHPAVLGIVS